MSTDHIVEESQEIRTLDITDLERIERFKRAGYGGSVSDAMYALGVRNTIFADRFKPLRQGMQLVGRALPIKLHSQVDYELTPGLKEEMEAKWEADEGGHPQKRMMRAVADAEDGVVLCFDCGEDMQPAHFGEMSCQLAYAHGCRGMLLGGNCRDTQYVLKMDDFPRGAAANVETGPPPSECRPSPGAEITNKRGDFVAPFVCYPPHPSSDPFTAAQKASAVAPSSTRWS